MPTKNHTFNIFDAASGTGLKFIVLNIFLYLLMVLRVTLYVIFLNFSLASELFLRSVRDCISSFALMVLAILSSVLSSAPINMPKSSLRHSIPALDIIFFICIYNSALMRCSPYIRKINLSFRIEDIGRCVKFSNLARAFGIVHKFRI